MRSLKLDEVVRVVIEYVTVFVLCLNTVFLFEILRELMEINSRLYFIHSDILDIEKKLGRG